LNEWDGEATTINESSIMSPCIGAGSKDSQSNTFSGVLMGKIKDTTKENSTAKHGLYGFNKGEEVFGFTEDGTAFIGKSSGGRIKFDGNESTIKSASYDEGGPGIGLDLDDAIFNLQTDNSTSLVKFNPDVKNDFKNPEMYLQTRDYDGKKGTRLDLINGYLKMNGMKTETKDNIEKNYSVSISNDPNGIPI
jgi:hypothetical protein